MAQDSRQQPQGYRPSPFVPSFHMPGTHQWGQKKGKKIETLYTPKANPEAEKVKVKKEKQPKTEKPVVMPEYMIAGEGKIIPWRRLGASLVDGLIVSIAAGIVFAVVMPAFFMITGGDVGMYTVITVLLGLFLTTVACVFEVLCTHAFQATLGKKLLGLRLICDSGKPSMAKVVVRTAVKLALCVVCGFIPLGSLVFLAVCYYQYRSGGRLLWDKMLGGQIYYYGKSV